MSINLLFCKAKVFIHTSKQASDNIPGFLIITHERDSSKSDFKLSWISETGITSEQKETLNRCDTDLKSQFHLDGSMLSAAVSTPWSFSVKLNSLYSVQFRLPSPSGWWFGSVTLHSKLPQEEDSLPILFFHDNLCPSTIQKQKQLKKSFDPFTSAGDVYWGGVDFKDAVSRCVDLKATLLDPSVSLVNATLDDLRNFSPNTSLKEPKPKRSDADEISIWDKLEATKWGLMSRIADATSKTGILVGGLIMKHPLVQLAERNRENVYVKTLLKNPRVQDIQDDFDSARVYLAKWAHGVKEQSDRFNLNNENSNSYRKLLNNELGMGGDRDVQFTESELNKALERNFPLTQQKWDSFFDSQGRIQITVREIKDFIFHGGIESMELRKQVWLYLLGVYPWDSSTDEKVQLEQTLRTIYENEFKSKWVNREVNSDSDEEEYWHDQIFRIEKDVKRNDRHIDIYKYNTLDGKAPKNKTPTSEQVSSDSSREPIDHEILNPHLICLKNILTSYDVFNSNLGYVQGMTDLLSPIYYIIQDEVLSFWCFVNFMERMERNFLRDQSGIRDQMLTLAELCQIMLPNLSEHLTKCDSSNLFFCFRMILVWFKREFDFDDVCSIWEIFFTDFYSSQFQLFFMLAILQKSSISVIQNLSQFDQILKYFNDINGTMDWNDLMTRSELLFIRFKKMMDLMERKREMERNKNDVYVLTDSIHSTSKNLFTAADQIPKADVYLQLLLSKKMIIEREGERTKDSIK